LVGVLENRRVSMLADFDATVLPLAARLVPAAAE
jgi:hypothetical protein